MRSPCVIRRRAAQALRDFLLRRFADVAAPHDRPRTRMQESLCKMLAREPPATGAPPTLGVEPSGPSAAT
jgi:hypothetical protein